MEDNENDVVASFMASVKCCAKNGTHCWAIDWLTSFNHNLSNYTAYQQSMHLTNTGYVMICDMSQTRINKANPHETQFVVGHQLSYSKFRKICEFAGPFSWTWLPVFIWAVLGDFKWFLKRRQETLDKWRELRVLLQLFALALSRGPRNNTVQAWLSVVHPEPNDKVGQTPRNYRETSKTCGMYRNIYVCVIVFMIK